jgi:hypothetical protein
MNPDTDKILHNADADMPEYRFSFAYLPAEVANCFREALGTYRSGLLQAFAAMCRVTAQSIFDDLGEGGKLKIFDEVDEVSRFAELDDDTVYSIRNILFDTNTESLLAADTHDRVTAAILLEIMKDVLYQTYVRRERLRKALRVRRYFADPIAAENEESADSKIAALNPSRSRQTGTG